VLKPEVERLSNVDVAVELARKEPDFDRSQEQNQQRAEVLANLGRHFRNVLEWKDRWYWEAFRLKGRSRVIALADFTAEKAFVLAVPHRFLIRQAGTGGGAVVADHARASGSEAAPAQLPILKDPPSGG
jgi:hypothetical protein